MTPLTSSPAYKRLTQQLDLTLGDVQELTKKSVDMGKKQFEDLRLAVDAYVDAKREMLSSNIDVQKALETLRQTLDTGMQSLPDAVQDGLQQAGALAKDTAEKAQAIGYEQWRELTREDATTTDRLVRVAGIGALLYAAYRSAAWALSKEGDSWLWRGFKTLGLAAAATWLVHTLGPKNTPKTSSAPKNAPKKTAPAKPAPAPVVPTPAPHKPAPAQPTPPTAKKAPAKAKDADPADSSVLASLPEGASLLDGRNHAFTLDGKQHTIAFRTDAIMLDNRRYVLRAKSVELRIKAVHRKGDILFLTAGAYWKQGTVQGDEAMLRNIVHTLLEGKAYSGKTDDGTVVEIVAANK